MSVSAAAAAGFDFSKFNSVQYEEKTYTIPDDFENIEVAADWETVELLPSKNENCQVVCSESDTLQYTVKSEDNTLKIEPHENSQWFEHIGVFWFSSSPKITIYCPKRNIKISLLRLPAEMSPYQKSLLFLMSPLQRPVEIYG